MAEQNYRNHTRIDPAYHLTLVPLLLFLLVATVFLWLRVHTFAAGVAIVGAVALFWVASLTRTYALRNQTRLIRLEERLRLGELGVATEGLTTAQLVGLRFASDGEVAALAGRAVREGLTTKQIKEAVQQWRADSERV